MLQVPLWVSGKLAYIDEMLNGERFAELGTNLVHFFVFFLSLWLTKYLEKTEFSTFLQIL